MAPPPLTRDSPEAAQFLETIGEEAAVIADHYERGRQRERAIGHFLAFARIQVAECTRRLFSVPDAIDEMRRAAKFIADLDDPAPALFVRFQLAALLADDGADADAAEARSLALQAIESAGNGHGYQALARVALALAELRAGELAEAERQAREASDTLRARGLRTCSPYADRALIRVLIARGDVERAAELATTALRELQDFGPFGIFDTPLRLAAAKAYRAAGRARDAAECARAALEQVARQADKVEHAELRAAFLGQVPENVELEALARGG